MCLTHVTTIGIDIFPYRNYKRWWLTWKGLRVWGKAGWVSLNSSYFARTWSRVQGLAIFSEMITISFMSNSFTRHALMSPCCSKNVTLLSREYRATVAWMSREWFHFFNIFPPSQCHKQLLASLVDVCHLIGMNIFRGIGWAQRLSVKKRSSAQLEDTDILKKHTKTQNY